MVVAYFDCINGAAGDMIVAALLDAGADPAALRSGLSSLGLPGYELRIDRVTKQGLAATRFVVELSNAEHQPHRHLRGIVAIIGRSALPASTRERSVRVFERLAEAEATVHGTTKDQVHFHEVGAVDSIVDIVGAVLALDLLKVDRIACSPIPVGSGTIKSAHGVLPVPAPATARLLLGVPIADTDEPGELTTPTGAALLTTLADSFGPIPPMALASIGYGAGTRDGLRRPNVLRVLLGHPVEPDQASVDQVAQLETNLDDATPQTIGYCMERLLQAGALDVFATPIQMK